MEVYEISTKIYLLKDLNVEENYKAITDFINLCFSKDERMVDFHNSRDYKFYVHDCLYPIPEDKRMYKKDKVYTFRIRTVDTNLCNYFITNLENIKSAYIKGIVSSVRKLPKKPIEKIYSITPIVIKNDEGYYKNKLTFEEFQERIKNNLKKKYEKFTSSKLESVSLYNLIKYKNKQPISIPYKDIKLLGDKLTLYVDSDELSQELAYFALGVGLGENNYYGLGYLGYRWC